MFRYRKMKSFYFCIFFYACHHVVYIIIHLLNEKTKNTLITDWVSYHNGEHQLEDMQHYVLQDGHGPITECLFIVQHMVSNNIYKKNIFLLYLGIIILNSNRNVLCVLYRQFSQLLYKKKKRKKKGNSLMLKKNKINKKCFDDGRYVIKNSYNFKWTIKILPNTKKYIHTTSIYVYNFQLVMNAK